jgi:hypothetical protein
MVEGLPISFQAPQENAVASYSYTDIAEGTGVVLFYGGTHIEDTTEAYSIASNIIESHSLYTEGATVGTSFTKGIDIDFDLSPFNLPETIKGTLNVVASMGSGGDGGSNSGEWYAIVKLRKWDGTTETDLAQAQSFTFPIPTGANNRTAKTTNFEINATAGFHFKKGEILRLTFEGWGKRIGADTNKYRIAHDPLNATDGTLFTDPIGATTTRIKYYIPFKLDL